MCLLTVSERVSIMKVFLTSNAVIASAIGAEYSVEAEYGSVLVKGTMITLAHHDAGKLEGFNICPCLNKNIENPIDGQIVISHIDWDTIGGILSCFGQKPDGEALWDRVWDLIAFIDENGSHREFLHETTRITRRAASAMYAWLNQPENRIFAPRDGSVMDVTDFIKKCYELFGELEVECSNGGEGPLHAAGDKFWAANEDLIFSSYKTGLWDKRVDNKPLVIIRQAPEKFINHLYNDGNGNIFAAVVGYDTSKKTITLSFEDGGSDVVSAGKIIQSMFGPLAGGKNGIGGGDRNHEYTIEDAERLAYKVVEILMEN